MIVQVVPELHSRMAVGTVRITQWLSGEPYFPVRTATTHVTHTYVEMRGYAINCGVRLTFCEKHSTVTTIMDS